jgi:hypothetical protein
MIFWREKEKKTASRFEAKKSNTVGDKGLSVASLVASQLYCTALYYSGFFGK